MILKKKSGLLRQVLGQPTEGLDSHVRPHSDNPKANLIRCNDFLVPSKRRQRQPGRTSTKLRDAREVFLFRELNSGPPWQDLAYIGEWDSLFHSVKSQK
jgi:hypothetical protein